MANEVEALVASGRKALDAGDWAAARDSFLAAVEDGEIADALLGLGLALWWLGDMPGSVANLERAYAAFRRRSDPAWALEAALRLSFHNRAHLGNRAAAAGWLARAKRLVEEHGLDFARGELLLIEAYVTVDLASAEASAREALELAREAGSADLELCALSQIGALLVQQGRVEEGVALLDESMAGALGGEGQNLETVVFTSCNMIVSCTSCAEFERATEWVRASDRFAERYGCPFLQAECRTVYGAVLVATGSWSRAEEELKAAISLAQDAVPAYHAEAIATLAELRLAQGRLEEAERLLVGLEGHHGAARVLARTYLVRGQPALAAATARRWLETVGDGRLESALLEELLGEAEIAEGHDAAAVKRGRALAGTGTSLGCSVILARGERLLGAALARSDAALSRRHLDAALREFVRLGMPYEAARTRRLLAEALREHEPEVAKTEARTALAAFEGLGAGADADAAAALLRGLGVKAARSGPKGVGALTKREREVLALLGQGLSNPEIAKRLVVSRKTVEHHVAHVMAKLGARSRAEAAAEAVRRLEAEPAGR